MKAMLLAAGLGTRLRPITEKIPKPLIPVNGIPLIFYNLALLKKYGIKEVVINLHHLGNQIKKILGSGKSFGFRFKYSFEKKILGTGGGIKKAEKLLKNGPFFVLNADIITDLDLNRMILFHQSQKKKVTLAVKQSPLAQKYGILYVNKQNEVTAILQKPSSVCQLKETFFTGVHLLESAFFDESHKKTKSCIIRDTYIPLLKKDKNIGAYLQKGYWNDLGTPERLQQTSRALKQGKVKLSYNKELTEFKKVLDRKNRLTLKSI